ncbi:hypothetical protein GPROT1_03881 [Gammaproteobacteria bacterium]|nr:hypothetical protein GPROT1_03881 [Gammaproteobacteria bacterium]
MARGMVLCLVALALMLGASSLSAAEPTGDSPTNALTVTCQIESMAAGSTVWHKIPYHKGMELAIDLTAIDGVYFDVFASDQVKYFPSIGQSLGRSVSDPNDPIYQRSWQGQLVQGDFWLDYYYVRMTNSIGIEVMYQLCVKEIKSSVVEPMGDNPVDGLTSAQGALQFLEADSQIWHKVPYHHGKELEIFLKTISTDISFDVFTPAQVQSWPTLGQPIGRGTYNNHEPEYDKSWQGHLTESDYYYVRVTNANPVQVQYQLCLIEKELPGPSESPTKPTPTRRPRFVP